MHGILREALEKRGSKTRKIPQFIVHLLAMHKTAALENSE
jgi:hypothetical protein